jgi:predicted phosphodiesterase
VKEMLNYIANNTKKEIEKTLWEPGHLRFWLIADTHIWARECDLDALHKYYDEAKKEWVECVLHAWDLVDWNNVYKWQQFEQSDVWYEEQIAKILQEYPDIWVPTYFIGWNHDESYLKSSWADICRTIDGIRDDLINLWYYDAVLNINGIKLQLQHGAWWSSYSPDYKLLRYIDTIPAGQEPDIFALGHYHRAIHSLHRWIHWFMPGAFLRPNLLAKRYKFPNIIGWWIIDVTKDEEWNKKLTATFINE